MSERYTNVFSLPENLYTTGAPVLISAGALLKDNQTGTILAQLKIRNISTKKILGIRVRLRLFDSFRTVLGAPVEFEYLDMIVSQGEEFGQKHPIPIPEPRTRMCKVSVTSVVFEDRSIWRAGDEPWKALMKPTRLEFRDPELWKQYKIEFGQDSFYKPVADRDLWCCTCGTLNRIGNRCWKCQNSLEALQNVDMAALTVKKDARLAREAAEIAAKRAAKEAAIAAKKAAAEAQRQKKEQRRKETLDEISSAVVSVKQTAAEGANCAVSAICESVDSAKRKRIAKAEAKQKKKEAKIAAAHQKKEAKITAANQKKAAKAAAAEEKRQAKAARRKKGKGRKAVAAVIILAVLAPLSYYVIMPWAIYGGAYYLMNQGKYEKALTAFAYVEDFRDSAEQMEVCGELLREENYQKAVALMESGEYVEALDIFITMRGYLGSDIRIKMCTEAILKEIEEKAPVYNVAEMLLADGETAQAAIAFGKLGDYSDARQRSLALWDEIARRDTVAVGDCHTVGLKTDGSVLAVNSSDYGQCDVEDWGDIIALDARENYTVGLKSDGTVLAVGKLDSRGDVENWTDIVAISTGDTGTMGLKMDGTVVITGSEYVRNQVADWQDIVDIGVGYGYAAGLRADGTVAVTFIFEDNPSIMKREILTDIVETASSWRDITGIRAASNYMVGLKSDGTVVLAGGNGTDQYDVSDWTDIMDIATGSGHVIGVKVDGTVVSTGNQDYADWTDIVAVAAGSWHAIGLKSDGTVIARSTKMDGRSEVSAWMDIRLSDRVSIWLNEVRQAGYAEAEELLARGETARAAMAFGKLGSYSDARKRSLAMWDGIARWDTISAGYTHTVGLESGGTVVAVGQNNWGECDVGGWTEIIAVDACNNYTLGLKSDGTVVAAGAYYDDIRHGVDEWTDIVAISGGYICTLGLKMDGTVVAAGPECVQNQVADWQDIVDVSAGKDFCAGLKADGTVVTIGNIPLDNPAYSEWKEADWKELVEMPVSEWTDIVAISVGNLHMVGLKADGTVVAAGQNRWGQCDVGDWTDIVALSAGEGHTVGLKADGTAVAVGLNETDMRILGSCDVSEWTDLVAVSAGPNYTVGLKADGTAVATGWDVAGRCNVSDWTDIKIPNQDSVQEIELYPEDVREDVYQQALTLMKQGAYFKAIMDFQKLGDYKDSETQLQKGIQQYKDLAYSLMEEGHDENAMDIFLKMEELGIDCSTEKQECEIAMRKHQYATSGTPISNEIAVHYTVEGDVEVHGFTRVDLDNGFVRYTIDCTPPKCSAVSFFNPPDGDIFMHTNWNDRAQERQNIVFDVTKEQIEAANELTIRFGESGSWIFVRYPY